MPDTHLTLLRNRRPDKAQCVRHSCKHVEQNQVLSPAYIDNGFN